MILPAESLGRDHITCLDVRNNIGASDLLGSRHPTISKAIMRIRTKPQYRGQISYTLMRLLPHPRNLQSELIKTTPIESTAFTSRKFVITPRKAVITKSINLRHFFTSCKKTL